MNFPRQTRGSPGFRWVARMAWRDSRGKRLLLLLFTSSVLFGTGAIVAIHSLRENLQRIVDEQARSLLGSDAVIQTRQPPGSQLQSFIGSLPGEKVRELRFRSMASFPESGESRFVQVRALDGPLPFYGNMEIIPESPASRHKPAPGKAIIEESLMLQLDLQPGDRLQLGEVFYEIEAALLRMAGESEVSGFFAPRIYIPMEGLEETGLIQRGSMVRYRTYVAVSPDQVSELDKHLAEAEDTLFVDESARVETVADRRRSIERVLNNLLDFLNLIGFIALLLGGIGIVGAVSVYLQTKRETIAVLRCLGGSTWMGFSIYLVQILCFGMVGAIAGSFLGVAAQFIIPQLLQSFLPFPVVMKISYGAIATGLVFGWVTVTCSALIPLLGIRRISPLSAIRASIEQSGSALRDPLTWLSAGVLLAGLLAFTILQSRNSLFALSFVAGLILVLAVLGLVAAALRSVLRRFRSATAPYSYRVALSNLYRPNNRTLLMISTLGMGVLLINILLLTRESLLGQVSVESSDDAANVILLDIQPDQKEAMLGFLKERGYVPESVLPIVTMRVEGIKGKDLRDYRTMEDSPVSDWVYTWEFRNTYRDHVLDNAEVIEGTFTPAHEGGEPFPVSLSDNVVEDLGVGIGDSITWNVQGVNIESYVDSIRRVQWQAGRQNFNVVFPLNTIEAAPTVFAVSIKTQDRVETAGMQREITEDFPNVSLIDLSLVFDTISEILGKASFVIKFMAGFTIATGLVVLSGAVLSSRYQRLQESVLFRTLGASRKFISRVLALEFLLLGLVAGLAGLILSYLCSWILLRFVFEVPFSFNPLGSIMVLGAVILLTLATGWFTSRGIATHPPLAVLRKE